MFDSDFAYEIWETITRQKWRSLMTAFGVFWGVLILVMLVGAGMGLKNGLIYAYTNIPTNSLICVTQATVLPYEGFDSGRRWNLKTEDMERLRQRFSKEINDIAILNLAVNDGTLPVSSGSRSGSYQLAGVNPTYIKAIPHQVTSGRYINDLDMQEMRAVCVIGRQVNEAVFGDKESIGKQLTVDGKLYTIVGVCQSTSEKIKIGVDLSASVLIPLTLMQRSYAQGDKIYMASIMLHDDYDPNEAESLIKPMIKEWHNINPEDQEALRVINLKMILGRISALFSGIEVLIWIVGLGTLLAGLIGISNIMMITVNERTQEIGVRRALGAEPSAIIRQIMCESLALTLVSSFTGLCVGLWLLYLLRSMLGEGNGSFTNPYMPFWTAIISLLILLAGGVVAGWMPAKRALAIKPIEALREE